MELKYIDRNNVERELNFTCAQLQGDNVFTVAENNNVLCKLVKEQGKWMELFHGATENAHEYGRLIDRFHSYPGIEA